MPKATYMYWQKRFDRENPDKEIEEKILEIRMNNKDYGYRRILGELRNQGYVINKKRVQRIIQKLGLQVTSYTRKSRKYSSYKGKVGTVAPNRIRRRFNTNIPHQKITTDTTEFKYYEVDEKGHMNMHKLYLDSFMDMCNGEILSYGIDKTPSAKNVMDALDKAIEMKRRALSGIASRRELKREISIILASSITKIDLSSKRFSALYLKLFVAGL